MLNENKNKVYTLDELSPREKECVKLILQGKTAKEAASILHLSPRTIEFYLMNARKKLSITRMTQILKEVWAQ